MNHWASGESCRFCFFGAFTKYIHTPRAVGQQMSDLEIYSAKNEVNFGNHNKGTSDENSN
jgi:hypothetical protein